MCVRRYLVYKSFVGELAMHLQEVDRGAEAASDARQQIERMILDKARPARHVDPLNPGGWPVTDLLKPRWRQVLGRPQGRGSRASTQHAQYIGSSAQTQAASSVLDSALPTCSASAHAELGLPHPVQAQQLCRGTELKHLAIKATAQKLGKQAALILGPFMLASVLSCCRGCPQEDHTGGFESSVRQPWSPVVHTSAHAEAGHAARSHRALPYAGLTHVRSCRGG